MERRVINRLIVVACIVIIFSVGAYIWKFSGQSISKDTGDWGAFSDYLNPFIAFINLLVIGWLSFSVYQYNLNRDRQNDFFQRSLERPVLVSKSTFDPARNPPEIWEIHNIGKGAALNLRITFKSNRQSNLKTPVIKAFSLGKDEPLLLTWIQWVDVIFIIYEDLFNNEYVTICADDESYTQPLNENFQNIEIKDMTFDRQYI